MRKCAADGCETVGTDRELFCRRHWHMIPRALRAVIHKNRDRSNQIWLRESYRKLAAQTMNDAIVEARAQIKKAES